MNQIIAASGEEVGGLDVVFPPLYEIFWSAVVLLVLLIIVGKFALPRLYQTLDERQEKIAEGLGAAEKAKEDRAAAARERDELIRQAQVDAQGIRDAAHEDAKRIIQAARSEAQDESARIIDTAERQILAERQAAEISLRSDVGLLASELAEKIIGEHLKDQELTSRVIDRFLDDLEADSAAAQQVETR
ncbi:F0F1 ATP synthase subunit B [Schaalia sp. ZJ405]|uniref:F0F1 ATP synthase subunit B n=1 Tax=unclassified Schaalia TaxID=2691889 RepID=UPI0013ECA05F|nr:MULTISPECIES: F0F1 ATP synthase subunit B [unclassified Schaalia]QPK80618.1 F0F1 ATP synthase subunit B [Schaalia sp. ZJ405]